MKRASHLSGCPLLISLVSDQKSVGIELDNRVDGGT
jgi:hypothetical protein